MNEQIRLNYYHTSGRLVFVRFSEELKTPKSPFEINWPLAVGAATLPTGTGEFTNSFDLQEKANYVLILLEIVFPFLLNEM